MSSGEWSVPVGGTSMSDLLAELERDAPMCPVCTTAVRPSVEPVKVYAVPVGEVPDRIALMPFHERCWPEAKERLERAKAGVLARAAAAGEN